MLRTSRINPNDIDSMAKQAEAQSALCNQAECGSTEAIPLVERLRTERARVSRSMTMRVKELDNAIRLLENSEAETIIKDATNTLYKLG